MKVYDIAGQLTTPVLVPAYGRDYKSSTAAVEAFVSGKDWILRDTGQYCSVRDCLNGETVILRYCKARHSVELTVIIKDQSK